jgi:hypothetical protein
VVDAVNEESDEAVGVVDADRSSGDEVVDGEAGVAV